MGLHGGPLQPGCIAKEPCVSGSVCHCGGPLRTGLRCFQSSKSQTGSVTAGSFAPEGQPNAIWKVYSRAELNLSCLEVSFLIRPETQNAVSPTVSLDVPETQNCGVSVSVSLDVPETQNGYLLQSLQTIDSEQCICYCLLPHRMETQNKECLLGRYLYLVLVRRRT